MKSIKTIIAFGIIALCMVNCSYPKEYKNDTKCKQDYLDSLNARYKYWTLAENKKDSANIYYMESTINMLSIECKLFQELSELTVGNLNAHHILKFDYDPFVDSIKSINRKSDSIEALRSKRND